MLIIVASTRCTNFTSFCRLQQSSPLAGAVAHWFQELHRVAYLAPAALIYYLWWRMEYWNFPFIRATGDGGWWTPGSLNCDVETLKGTALCCGKCLLCTYNLVIGLQYATQQQKCSMLCMCCVRGFPQSSTVPCMTMGVFKPQLGEKV